jgi:hypothetical protein
MKCLIPHITRHFGNQNAAFCFGPTEHFADETECVGLDAERHVFALIAADFLHARVAGPGTDWDLDIALVMG